MESGGETPRVRKLALAAAAVALLELALALWAAWIALSVGGGCPASGGAFSCEAIFRPKLASLMGIPIAKVGLIGAIASLASAALLAKAKPSGGFARASAFGALAGAAFAIGVQPLSWIGAGAVCPVCLGIVVCAVAFAALATSIAIKMKKDVLLAVLFAVCVGGIVGQRATYEGRRIRTEDGIALRNYIGGYPLRLPWIREAGPRPLRLVLVERMGCPFCRAVRCDVLWDSTFQSALREARVGTIEIADESPHDEHHVLEVPTLIVLEGQHELGRVQGYYPTLEPYLELLEKVRAK
jgi:uncharacterized membrane protein